MRSDRRAAGLMILLFLLAACATFEPPPPFDDHPLRERAVTKVTENIRVSTALPTAEEARAIFGIDLALRSIQPVWLEIKNGSMRPVLFFPTGLDPEYFTPGEVAFAYHRAFSGEANARLDDHLLARAFPPRTLITPGATLSGFVFTYQNEGSMIFNVDLVGRKWNRTVSFFVPVPGADMGRPRPSGFAELSRRIGSVEIGNEVRLREELEALPCCTIGPSGAADGLPLNFVLVGDASDWAPAFSRRGYRIDLSRPLYAFGRIQDISGRKFSRWVTGQPHSIRLWLTPLRYFGKSIWIGQVSTVLGGRFADPDASQVEANIDEARNDVVGDILYSQAVVKLGFVSGAGPASVEEPRGAPDESTYRTDGLRAVLLFGGQSVALPDLEFFDWERLVK